MLLMAVSGAAVLALVCWAMFNEAPPSFVPLIPHRGADDRAGRSDTAPDEQVDVVPAQDHAGWEQADDPAARSHDLSGDPEDHGTGGPDGHADRDADIPRRDER